MITCSEFCNRPPQKGKNLKQTMFSRPKALTMLTLTYYYNKLNAPWPRLTLSPENYQPLQNLSHSPYPARKKSRCLWNACHISYLVFRDRLEVFYACMWKTGTLSYEEFENDLLDFLERARKVGDPWNLEILKVQSWNIHVQSGLFAENHKLLLSSLLCFSYIVLICTRNGWTVYMNYACSVLYILHCITIH